MTSPNETDCQYHNNSIRSHQQCIILNLMSKYNCLPKGNVIFTYVILNYNYSQFVYKICKNNSLLSNNILSKFRKLCRKSCFEVTYEPIMTQNELSQQLFHLSYYVEYNILLIILVFRLMVWNIYSRFLFIKRYYEQI